MIVKAHHISSARLGLLAITGLACFAYAALALAQNRPDPFYWWVPGLAGVVSSVLIFALAFAAGRRESRMAMDELYRQTSQRAAAQAYWVSLGLFVLAVGLINWVGLDAGAVMASLGTSMGAAYLMLFVFHDLRAN